MKNKSRNKEVGALPKKESSKIDFLNKISVEEKIIIERIKELSSLLKAKYNLSVRDLIHLTDEKEILIPVSIFTKKLRILESIVKYLKEELNLSYHNIGIALNRDERNIWQTYQRAIKKLSEKLQISPAKYFIPASIFQNELSILENICIYMKDELKLSYHEIAVLLQRNDRTIWAMYNRGKSKK